MEDLKKDMAHWRSVLQARLVQDIEESLFVLKVCRYNSTLCTLLTPLEV